MIIVCEADRRTNTIIAASEVEFEDFNAAMDYMLETFVEMYGDAVAETNFEFWDPELEEHSVQVFSIEMFPKKGDEGLFLFKDWDNIH